MPEALILYGSLSSPFVYGLLDRTRFRELADLRPYPNLNRFVAENASYPRVRATDPRRA